MKYKYLGKTGIQVSSLSFGTMTFGHEADEAASLALYQRCREAGINLFDCANIYHEGKSEQILGKLIKHERQEVIITSKVFFPTNKDVNGRGLSRSHIMKAVEQSLKRLDTDYIDIYFMHHFDDNTPLEESLRAFDDLVTQGKIRYLGASNFAAWQIMKALKISDKHDYTAITCIQPMYNLVKRQVEVEILPMAQSENIAVLSYNPLAAGLLTGKYTKPILRDEMDDLINQDVSSHSLHQKSSEKYTEKHSEKTKFEKGMGRLSDNKMYQARYGDSHAIEIAAHFCQFALDRGYSPAALAIAWVGSNPAITSPLLGARNIEQLDECLKATDITITPELRMAISGLTPVPPLPTDRSDELRMAHI